MKTFELWNDHRIKLIDKSFQDKPYHKTVLGFTTKKVIGTSLTIPLTFDGKVEINDRVHIRMTNGCVNIVRVYKTVYNQETELFECEAVVIGSLPSHHSLIWEANYLSSKECPWLNETTEIERFYLKVTSYIQDNPKRAVMLLIAFMFCIFMMFQALVWCFEGDGLDKFSNSLNGEILELKEERILK